MTLPNNDFVVFDDHERGCPFGVNCLVCSVDARAKHNAAAAARGADWAPGLDPTPMAKLKMRCDELERALETRSRQRDAELRLFFDILLSMADQRRVLLRELAILREQKR